MYAEIDLLTAIRQGLCDFGLQTKGSSNRLYQNEIIKKITHATKLHGITKNFKESQKYFMFSL